ncbi:MAG TPA: hypothetical protein VGM88_05965 [Kofleriaceae bacterium]|jgi:hypothetical protein
MRRIALVGLVLVAACEREGGDDKNDPKPLLDRWAEALGGRDHLATVTWHPHTRYRMTQGLAQHLADEYDSLAGKRATLDDDGTIKTLILFDGTHEWLVDGNGFRTELAGTQRQRMITNIYMRHFGWALKPHDAVITRDGETLTIVPAGGSPVVVALDHKTHLPASYSHADGTALADNVVTEPTFEKRDGYYEEVASTWHDGLGAHGSAERIARDDELPAHMFEAPDERPVPHPAAPIVVPIHLEDHQWHATFTVNGAPTDMMISPIDTSFRLDGDTIRARGIATSGDFNFSDSGGKPGGRYITGATIGVGDVVVDHLLGFAPARSQPNSIGGALYHSFVVELDPTNHELRLSDRDHFTPPADAIELPLTYDHGYLEVPLSMALDDNALAAGNFILSFSDGAPFAFGMPFVEAYKLESHSTPIEGTKPTAENRVPKYVHLRRVMAAGKAIGADLYGGYTANEKGSRASLAGMVTPHAFPGRTLALDLAHGRAWLEPQAKH